MHTIKSVKGLLPCTLSNTLGYDPLYYRARTHERTQVSQHVTIDPSFLQTSPNDEPSFMANCDRGMTWPEDVGEAGRWEPNTEFE